MPRVFPAPGMLTVPGTGIGRGEAMALALHPDIDAVFESASAVRERHRGRLIDLCSIVSAKTGACPEDCAYCAQSSRARAQAAFTPLMSPEEIAEKARAVKQTGARRFCIVTGGRKPSPKELDSIARALPLVRAEGLLPCATLGLLDRQELQMLKDAGLVRFHHNLETSRRFFPSICSTHTYEQKLRTIEAVREAGLSLCCGGIFGLGETWEDRVDMALDIRALGADSVPINFLMPVGGTPLGDRPTLPPLEALRVISVIRHIMPDREVRVCGGRLQTLGDHNELVFKAGADGLLTGNYLTTPGQDPGADLKMIERQGLQPAPLAESR